MPGRDPASFFNYPFSIEVPFFKWLKYYLYLKLNAEIVIIID